MNENYNLYDKISNIRNSSILNIDELSNLIEVISPNIALHGYVLSLFDELANKCGNNYFINYLSIMAQLNNASGVFESHMNEIVDMCSTEHIEYLPYILSKLPNGDSIMKKNFGKMINKSGENIGELLYRCSDIKIGIDYFKDKNYILYLVLNANTKKTSLSSRKLMGLYTLLNDEIYSDGIDALVENLAGEKMNEQNISFIGDGVFSYVFKIKEYVFKIRFVFPDYTNSDLIYDPNIAQPLLRNEIRRENGNDNVLLEVFRLLETKNIPETTGKEMRDKLIENGIMWDDNQIENIGRLRSGDSNIRIIPHGYGGIIDLNKGNEENKLGEYVVIDAEHMRSVVMDEDNSGKSM